MIQVEEESRRRILNLPRLARRMMARDRLGMNSE